MDSCVSGKLVFWIPVSTGEYWIPAYAGMTTGERDILLDSDKIIDTCCKL
jgi:hypothetical protein